MNLINPLIAIALGFLLSNQAQGESSFYDLSPKPSVIAGVQYPRNHLVSYRGTSAAQLDLNHAIRAMFGDETAVVESLFFATIKNKLLGRSFAYAVELSSYLEKQIQQIRKNHAGSFSEKEAVAETIKLVSGTLDYLFAQRTVESTYVNYQSESFVDWPKDVVFTTIVSPAAATYGDRILVFKPKSPRSLDLNYWNKVHNNVWYHFTRDAGEFISFGYVPSEDIIGYQLRMGAEKSWHSIRTAFYKVVNDGKTAILVFSGQKESGSASSCIDFNSANQTYYHCHYRPGSLALEPPPLGDEKVKLLGVIVMCNAKSEQCDLPPAQEVAKYQTARRENLDVDLSSIKIDGRTLRFIVP